jgi:hypothetical protein
MSEGNGPNTEELAYLLWERQSRLENRSSENWLEAEYLARSLAASTKDGAEADLRMRGLGPLTQIEPPSRIGSTGPSANSSESANSSQPGHGASRPSPITLCVAGTALVIALGMLLSIFRKTG